MKKALSVAALAVAALVLASPAAAETTRTTYPYDFTVEACGNTIHVTGEFVAMRTETATPSGEIVVSSLYQPRNVSGTDEFGRLYIATGVERIIGTSGSGSASTFTYVLRWQFVGTMGAPTVSITATLHVTRLPSGEVLFTIVDLESVECH